MLQLCDVQLLSIQNYTALPVIQRIQNKEKTELRLQKDGFGRHSGRPWCFKDKSEGDASHKKCQAVDGKLSAKI